MPDERAGRRSEVLTVAQMYEADRLAMDAGIPGIELMEAAGRAVAERALEIAPADATILVICGPGNNGGDGFVAARHLEAAGRQLRLALLGSPESLSGDAAAAAEAWEGAVEALDPGGLAGVGLVVDALFGAGLNRALEGEAAALVKAVAEAEIPVLAVDVPSGIAGDRGEPLGGLAFRAAATVTFFRRKPAHLLAPSRGFCGTVSQVDIGIPESVLERIGVACSENGPPLWLDGFPWRRADAHKYQAGHALICGGATMTGAAQLASRTALRVGAGLVTVACTADSLPVYALANPSVITLPLAVPEDFAAALEDPRRNALLLGPGNGATAETRARALLALAGKRAVVLDADALTVFEAGSAELFAAIAAAEGETVLTPHDGEFKRLFPDLEGSRLERARAAAQRCGATLVLKGPDSVVAAPDGRASINPAAPPWLATAGTGDVLAGMVTGLLAQGMPAFEAASAAVWLHAAAAFRFGPGMISEDLPDALPDVLGELYEVASSAPARSEIIQ